jgi:hypothetical protein
VEHSSTCPFASRVPPRHVRAWPATYRSINLWVRKFDSYVMPLSAERDSCFILRPRLKRHTMGRPSSRRIVWPAARRTRLLSLSVWGHMPGIELSGEQRPAPSSPGCKTDVGGDFEAELDLCTPYASAGIIHENYRAAA